ncbi:MAG: phosphoglycerate dehydrogenase [Pseudomonadota bacterium]
MKKVCVYNAISPKGTDLFDLSEFQVEQELNQADAILLRSHKLTPEIIDPTVKCIARAGAGTNNVPVEHCTEQGIPVFNSPGANANAVKELVLAALLLGSRGIVEGYKYVSQLQIEDDAEMAKLLEKEKKNYKGNEIKGQTLGVIGLGAIGSMVAEMALSLGMNVIGYDPALSVEAAWRLPKEVTRMESVESLLSESDYITLHLPAIEATHHMVNADTLKHMKPTACLLNFAREQIVDTDAVVAALDGKELRRYICDFPTNALLNRDDVIYMPHIGASTDEAEENCAVMAVEQIIDFLRNGNIKFSVNFPRTYLERKKGFRLSISNQNVPKVLGQVLSVFADHNINVIDMINKSRNDIAYNLIDVATQPSDEVIDGIKQIDGILRVHSLS